MTIIQNYKQIVDLKETYSTKLLQDSNRIAALLVGR